MSYVWLIVERASNSRLEPIRAAVLEAPGRQQQLDLFRRMLVIRVPHERGKKGHADRHIVAAF